ncbi:MAG: hypothetical protein LBB94_10430 [Clostridiales bacterium]|jgi:hypothetical protein|nr:hypothetical protein [Clostridiales bacterium]
MYPLEVNIAGDLANGSTANVAIIAAVVIFGIIMLHLYFRRGGKLKAGNIEIGNTSIGVPIQRIDDTCKLKCREALNGLRETVLAEIPSTNKLVCEAVVDRILNPLYESITRNHFTHTFSGKEKNEAWIKRVHDDIFRNIKVVEWHCDTNWQELHTPDFDAYIISLIEQCRQLFIDPVIEACYAKIEAYQKCEGESKKECIEKNENYIKALKS